MTRFGHHTAGARTHSSLATMRQSASLQLNELALRFALAHAAMSAAIAQRAVLAATSFCAWAATRRHAHAVAGVPHAAARHAALRGLRGGTLTRVVGVKQSNCDAGDPRAQVDRPAVAGARRALQSGARPRPHVEAAARAPPPPGRRHVSSGVGERRAQSSLPQPRPRGLCERPRLQLQRLAAQSRRRAIWRPAQAARARRARRARPLLRHGAYGGARRRVAARDGVQCRRDCTFTFRCPRAISRPSTRSCRTSRRRSRTRPASATSSYVSARRRRRRRKSKCADSVRRLDTPRRRLVVVAFQLTRLCRELTS